MSEDEGAARTMRGAKTATKRAAREKRIVVVLTGWLVVGVVGEVRVARLLRGGRKSERVEGEVGRG